MGISSLPCVYSVKCGPSGWGLKMGACFGGSGFNFGSGLASFNTGRDLKIGVSLPSLKMGISGSGPEKGPYNSAFCGGEALKTLILSKEDFGNGTILALEGRREGSISILCLGNDRLGGSKRDTGVSINGILGKEFVRRLGTSNLLEDLVGPNGIKGILGAGDLSRGKCGRS